MQGLHTPVKALVSPQATTQAPIYNEGLKIHINIRLARYDETLPPQIVEELAG
jgi:hypothetical protein